LDVYICLAYRLHSLTKATPVTLHGQFGAACSAIVRRPAGVSTGASGGSLVLRGIRPNQDTIQLAGSEPHREIRELGFVGGPALA